MTEASTQSTISGTDSSQAGPSNSRGSDSSSPPAALPPSFDGTKHKIDFDGQEFELDYKDLIDGFKRSSKDAVTLRSQMQQLSPVMEMIQSFQKGDFSALRNFADQDSLRQYHEKELLEYIETQQMDPREREMIDREKKLAAWEEQQTKQKDAYEKQVYEQQVQKAHEEVQLELVDAIKELAGDMKVTPRFARRVAEYLYANLENQKPITAKDAAKREFDELGRDYGEYQTFMLNKDPTGFVSRLPPEVIQAIREADLAARKPLKAFDNKPAEDDLDIGGDNKVDIWTRMDRHFDKKRKQRG